jgi:hypothetical protein
LLDHWALPAIDNIPSYSICFINQGKTVAQRGDRLLRLTHSWLRCTVYAHARNSAPLAHHRSFSIMVTAGNIIPVWKKHIEPRQTSNTIPAYAFPTVLTCPGVFAMPRRGKLQWVWNTTDTRLRVLVNPHVDCKKYGLLFWATSQRFSPR